VVWGIVCWSWPLRLSEAVPEAETEGRGSRWVGVCGHGYSALMPVIPVLAVVRALAQSVVLVHFHHLALVRALARSGAPIRILVRILLVRRDGRQRFAHIKPNSKPKPIQPCAEGEHVCLPIRARRLLLILMLMVGGMCLRLVLRLVLDMCVVLREGLRLRRGVRRKRLLLYQPRLRGRCRRRPRTRTPPGRVRHCAGGRGREGGYAQRERQRRGGGVWCRICVWVCHSRDGDRVELRDGVEWNSNAVQPELLGGA
jgi:hypothetical protein